MNNEKIKKWRDQLSETRRRLGPYTHYARNGPSTAIEQGEIARRNVEVIEVLLDILDSMQTDKP